MASAHQITHNMNDLTQKLEAVLFWKGEPTTKKELAKILGTSAGDIEEGLASLREALSGRGLALMEKDDSVMLTTAPAMSGLIEGLLKESLERDLGKAGLETLTLILYYGPITRARIDYIRGVNSTFSLRQLMIRGLVERIDNPNDARGFLYKPTFELLSFLGITKLDELPNYADVRAELEQFEKQKDETDAPTEPTTDATDTGEAA